MVDDDDIAEAMVLLLERGKLLAEGAGAAATAALLSGAVKPARCGVTAVIVSGGNVDAKIAADLIAAVRRASDGAYDCERACPTGPAGLPLSWRRWPASAQTSSSSRMYATMPLCHSPRRASSCWSSSEATSTRPLSRNNSRPLAMFRGHQETRDASEARRHATV